MNGLESLVAALNSTFSPSTDAVSEGEKHLRVLETQPSYTQALLRILAAPDVPPQTKLAAAIALKRVVSKRWGELPPDDVAFIKSNILDALCSVPNLSVRKQLAIVVGTVAQSEYIQNYAFVTGRLTALITSNNFSNVHGALMGIAAILKNFCFMHNQGADTMTKRTREIFETTINTLFPHIEVVMDLSLAQTSATKEAMHVNSLILKIFNLATLPFLPGYFRVSEERVLKWTYFGRRVIELALLPPAAPELKGSALWWKPVRKAVNVFARLLGRYCISDDDTDATVLAAHKNLFVNVFDKPFIDLFCAFVRNAPTTDPPSALLSIVLRLLARSVPFGRVSQRALRPAAAEIVSSLLLPLLCATPEELDLVEDAPVEYIHQDLDISLYSVRLSARELLCEMCSVWPETVIAPAFTLAQNILLNQQNIEQAPSQKCGAYEVVTALCKVAGTSSNPGVPTLTAHVEKLLKCCVVSDMKSPHPAVRVAAIKCFTRFSSSGAGGWQDGGAFAQGLEALIRLASDGNLAVAVSAVLSLRFAVQTAAGKEMLRPVIERVLELLYRFIEREDLDIDELVAVLECFVDVYRSEIATHALGICSHVAGVFNSIAWAAVDDRDDNMISKAASCLSTLTVTCAAVGKSQDLLAELGRGVVPFVTGILSKGQERYGCYTEEVMKLAHALLRHTERIPSEYWDLFLLAYKACAESPLEDYNSVHWVFVDFVTRTGQAFLANPAFATMVLTVCTRVLDAAFSQLASGDGDNDYGYELFKACQLAEAVIQHFPGKVDGFVAGILGVLSRNVCTAALASAQLTHMHKVLSAELVSNCLYYNPALTVRTLEASGALGPLFTGWHSSKTKFSRPYDKKLAILGLGSMLLLPGELLPRIVQSSIPQVITLLLYMYDKLEAQNKSIERESKYGYASYENDDDDNEDDGDEDDGFGGGFDELDEFDDSFDGNCGDNDEDGNGDGYGEGEEFDQDDYFSMDCYDVEDEDENAEDGSPSRSANPLDEIDVTAFLKKVFQSMSGDVYAQGVIFLSPEQKSKISTILNY